MLNFFSLKNIKEKHLWRKIFKNLKNTLIYFNFPNWIFRINSLVLWQTCVEADPVLISKFQNWTLSYHSFAGTRTACKSFSYRFQFLYVVRYWILQFFLRYIGIFILEKVVVRRLYSSFFIQVATFYWLYNASTCPIINVKLCVSTWN